MCGCDIEKLKERIDELEKNILSKMLPKVSIPTKTLDSGIQLVSGPTIIEKVGVILSVIPIQTPAGSALGAVVKIDDSDEIMMVDMGACKFL